MAAFCAARKGLARKCLVLDLDNTLWGGVVGEDGVAGLKLGGAFPGNALFLVGADSIRMKRHQNWCIHAGETVHGGIPFLLGQFTIFVFVHLFEEARERKRQHPSWMNRW